MKTSRAAVWLLAAGVAAAVVAVIEMPRLWRGPLPEELLPAGPARPAPWLAATLALGAGGLAASLVCGVRRLAAAAGGFGAVAAAGLAAAATGLALGSPAAGGSDEVVYGTVPLFGVTSAALSPLLRDRGLLSLLVVSLLVGAAVVPARRHAMAEAAAAERLARARDAVLQTGVLRAYASMPPDVEPVFCQALAVSLRPPHRPEAIDLLCVEHDAPEEESLRAAGLRGVRFEGGAARLLPVRDPGEREPAGFPFDVVLREPAERGPVALVRPSEGRFTLRVVTPAGTVRQDAEDPIHGIGLLGDALARYRALVDPLPPGSLVLVKVETALFPDGSAWLEHRLP